MKKGLDWLRAPHTHRVTCERGKKARTIPNTGGKSVIKKFETTRINKNPFEKSSSKHPEYVVCVWKNKRTHDGRMVLSSFPKKKYDL